MEAKKPIKRSKSKELELKINKLDQYADHSEDEEPVTLENFFFNPIIPLKDLESKAIISKILSKLKLKLELTTLSTHEKTIQLKSL